MSRQRRQVINLEDAVHSTHANGLVTDRDSEGENNDDNAIDTAATDRVSHDDILPTSTDTIETSQGKAMEIDNKVANFLAEIDALEPAPNEAIIPPTTHKVHAASPTREKHSPVRERSPAKSKSNAYSNMFVKGTSEFVKNPQDINKTTEGKVELEPWPEEPQTDWQQLIDEKTSHPYYWNTVTNQVVWDIPPEFSAFLLLHNEYEEKVERGLKEGKLDPKMRGQKKPDISQKKEDKNEAKPSQHASKYDRNHSSASDDSSTDSSDSNVGPVSQDRKYSDKSVSRDHKHDNRSVLREHKHENRTTKYGKSKEGTADSSNKSSHDKSTKMKISHSSEVPDSSVAEDNSRVSTTNKYMDDSMEFDIDDIDKELEMALERKRQELMQLEEKKKDDVKTVGKDKVVGKDIKKDELHRHRDELDQRDERNKKHGKQRDKDNVGDKIHFNEYEKEEKPKLTLKERLRIEMELKLEKERKKKRAIEELMARELEQTVGSSGIRSYKRLRDDGEKPLKRFRQEELEMHKMLREGGDLFRVSVDDYNDYSRDSNYGYYERRNQFENRPSAASIKPPPPTAEMVAYEEERQQVVDYGHGRSRHFDQLGDSDSEGTRTLDVREMEMRKLEALQLAELALSKLEFLEVTKKGLSKLQILLIELETRHQDWQSGGLTTVHFLKKLREANWQLEQYEASAAPAGWVCSWDRDYRRYFYTHKLTGKTQWDYPDADEIEIEDKKAQNRKAKMTREQEISASNKGKAKVAEKDLAKDILASAALPPPPPPPAEEHPVVKSLMLSYGSSSESDVEEQSIKSKAKTVQQSMPPLPSLPPNHSKEKKDRHKKKKKKEKSKKKDKVEPGVIGPVVPILAASQPLPSGTELQIMSTQVMSNEQSEWFHAQGTTVPVYGSVVPPEQFAQNDQPLEFGSVIESQQDMDTSEGAGPAVVSHAAETYAIVPPEYVDSGAGEPAFVPTELSDGMSNLDVQVGAVPEDEKKKKKKDKVYATGLPDHMSIALKKKNVSSMVQKWQKVKKEVELEEQTRQMREAEIRRKLAELQ